ncbi:Pyridoxamine 5'-phosphate oxidase [Mycobacteroides abscessus subsp. bolletii]|nr:Pyridoxamine 5'-phosphate oxidase [Mycobacteroides abscessus subsp. bolletii]SKQ45117.1 Pyridoxamine 5'-phosphate oxidase [Mycobacteroides abscessus subsp. bolletii]SKQ47941.1 Pyridoxamine 5'-phosphate oxidase [Mycobacteroides abscessus subsp. bolletii]SKQ49765.1 Pyridoxamine 5'-phosphate oxidase [Mycobacteroides abscessus subsp. bolletii]
MVTGLATVLTDPDLIARYETLLQPWANLPMGTVLAITPQIITGIRINTVAVP